ncbi:acetylxylan esterase [Olivibacter sp. SDN3]|nr:acetylxylan esterase [Olivibacter sp. SDN3]
MLYGQEGLYDEDQIPPYSLPDILKRSNGQTVHSVAEWERWGRPETQMLFEKNVYGKTLGEDLFTYEVTSEDTQAIHGTAIRKEVTIYLSSDKSKKIALLIYLPKRNKPVPVFLGLNFIGNQAIYPDTGITISKQWTAFGGKPGFTESGYATEESRGVRSSRWPVELILSKGYGLATAYYGDVELDKPTIDQSEESFHKWFFEQTGKKKEADSWGAIGVWAWELSKALDYLFEDATIDAQRVAVIGHSRLGKAALWAAAQDKRFAMAIANNSGEGGAAITRRRFGETIERINKSFPHWFCDNFKQFNGNEDNLPVDFHQLLGLVAPRPLYVASASDDLWADPLGEYLSLYHAGPVYQLYGQETLSEADPPPVGKAVTKGNLGYHIRPGKHDITVYDWTKFLDFADKHL